MPFRSHSYTPLDDTEECTNQVPLNQLTDVDDDEETGTGLRRSCLRINIAHFSQIWHKIIKPRRSLGEIFLCIVTIVTVLSVCLSLGYYTLFVHKPVPLIDKSYRAFRIPNHEASLNYEALQNARRNHTSFAAVQLKSLKWLFKFGDSSQYGRYGRAADTAPAQTLGRRTRSTMIEMTQYIPEWRMQVVFLAKNADNIFTKERLKTVHNVELNIMKHERYQEFCFKDIHPNIYNDPAVKAYNGCSPLNSLLTYFYPSKDEKGNIYYDGLGENMDNLDSALKLAMMSTHFYYYVDEKVNSTNLKSQLLRTEVLFGAPLKGFDGPYSDRTTQTQRFKEFVVTYIDLLSKSSTEDVTVLYGGKEIFDYEVEYTFWSDVRLAVYALIAIFLLMLVLTSGSIWLTTWGIVSILLSAPLAIFFYRVVFNVIGLGILNGAAAFVIIGIGVDDVFVFINVFRQADHIKEARARTMFTIKTAGKATFFTSFTTAAAFAANIASMIPAVHDFGLFMSLIVANCWLTVMMVMPPVLYIWHRSFCKWENKMIHLVCRCFKSSSLPDSLKLPDEVAHFMDGRPSGVPVATLTRQVTDEDADVPMLSMETPTLYVDDEDDEALVLVDPDPLMLPEDSARGGGGNTSSNLGSTLQALLYHFMALPIIKARWVIVGLSFVILCVSIGFMTQLHTSTKPPQFFRETTNMQQLLDLKAKFSAIDMVQCFDCSAIYNIGQRTARPKHITKPTTKRPRISSPDTIATVKPRTAKPVYTPPVTKHTPRPTPIHWYQKPHPLQTPAPPITKKPVPKSLPEDFDVCKDRDCSHPKERPLLESGATVYVVLGIRDFQWSPSEMGHVMSEDVGQLTFDSRFSSMFNFSQPSIMKALGQMCTLCKRIANNTELVRNGSAQCIPMNSVPRPMKQKLFDAVSECKDLPSVSYIYGNQQPAHALGSLTNDGTAILWLGFAFESTTSKSMSYFEAYEDYKKWEEFLSTIKDELDPESPLQDMFQTSEFWPEVLMEIVAVNSAIYSVVLSLLICMVAVTMFTGHVMLLLVIMISIIEMVCVVVAIFYILGWEIGGVEAISLSILVGSSVDYCVHLVEGYVLAAAACPHKDNAKQARHWRTSAAFSHIGVSILSSALTTIIAAVPLTQTTIQPFAKFGQIIAINTSVCIVYSLTVCTALLSTIAPAFFRPSVKSMLKIILGTVGVVGLSILTLFVMSKIGVNIPGPNGGALFSP